MESLSKIYSDGEPKESLVAERAQDELWKSMIAGGRERYKELGWLLADPSWCLATAQQIDSNYEKGRHIELLQYLFHANRAAYYRYLLPTGGRGDYDEWRSAFEHSKKWCEYWMLPDRGSTTETKGGVQVCKEVLSGGELHEKFRAVDALCSIICRFEKGISARKSSDGLAWDALMEVVEYDPSPELRLHAVSRILQRAGKTKLPHLPLLRHWWDFSRRVSANVAVSPEEWEIFLDQGSVLSLLHLRHWRALVILSRMWKSERMRLVLGDVREVVTDFLPTRRWRFPLSLETEAFLGGGVVDRIVGGIVLWELRESEWEDVLKERMKGSEALSVWLSALLSIERDKCNEYDHYLESVSDESQREYERVGFIYYENPVDVLQGRPNVLDLVDVLIRNGNRCAFRWIEDLMGNHVDRFGGRFYLSYYIEGVPKKIDRLGPIIDSLFLESLDVDWGNQARMEWWENNEDGYVWKSSVGKFVRR